MSHTARIVRFHQTGSADVLQFDELPVSEPGPGEVRLRVKAIGLNRAEVMFRYGHYFEQPVLPSKNGGEASGVVEAVGPDVDRSLIGKRVSTLPGTFKFSEYGVYGEVATVPSRSIAEYPPSLSFVEGAAIWMQYLTAYGALIWQGQVAKGDFVLITAASSSVGLAAIEIAKAEGAISIAVTRTATKKAQLVELGADHVIVTDEEDLVAKVNEITSGKGARIVFDPIGGKIVEQLAASSAYRGTIYLYGAMASEPTPYPLFTAFAKALTIRAFSIYEMYADPVLPKAMEYVAGHLAAGTLKPVIAKTFAFDDIVESHRYMESNAQVGKIVVTV